MYGDGCIVFSKQHRCKPYYPRIEIGWNLLDLVIQNILERLRRPEPEYSSQTFVY